MNIKESIKSKLKGNFGIFLYRIMGDILAVLLLSFGIVLVGESIMPGLISGHVSFIDLTLAIVPLVLFMAYVGKINGITFKIEKKKTALVGGLALFFALLIVNSLLKFEMWEIVVITTASLALLYYLFKIANNFDSD